MKRFKGGGFSTTRTVEILQTQTQQLESEKGKRVGILGGTFNPVHNGHLIIADQVMDKLNLDKVYFMPNNQPPHVDAKTAINPRCRLEMLCLALRDNLRFDIETIELERGGRSYTIETMETLTRRHPDVTYYFIIGADMVEYLPKWYRIDDLVKLVQFVGVRRPGYKLESPYPIMVVDVPEIDISSSLIRKKLANGESIRYLVPDAVYAYIIEKGLYRDV